MVSSRVTLNRSKVDRVVLAVADSMFELALRIVHEADPPDAAPYGVGLIETGGVIAFVDGKKVNDSRVRGRAIRKPRGLRTPKGQIVVAGGFDWPAHLVHNGTIKVRANPFLARPFNAHAATAEEEIAAIARPKVAAVR